MATRTAFLFPGQGSQSVGMLAQLAGEHESVETTFSRASEQLGYDLWDVVQNGPEDRLNQTEVTQPAMLAADIATWRIWLSSGGEQPHALAGHSLGEYAALVAAGSIAFEDAVKLVAERGRLMQAATPPGTGAMAAVLGLEDALLEEICQEIAGEEVVSCANYNSPGQVVIAGHSRAVERACEAARAAGARRALLLPVSVPSHCALMAPAAEGLQALLADIDLEPPAINVYHNIDARPRTSAGAIREALVAQVREPVLWTRTIQAMASNGISRMAECGPGKVLAGLNRRIDRELPCAALVDSVTIDQTISEWREP